MVNQRKPTFDNVEENLSQSAIQQVNEILEELVQNAIEGEDADPDLSDDEDEDDDEEVVDEEGENGVLDVEYDSAALYDELWGDVLTTIHNYGDAINSQEIDEQADDPFLLPENLPDAEVTQSVSVEYGPLSSFLENLNNSSGDHSLTVYLLPNVQNFNTHNFVETPRNTHYVRHLPTVDFVNFIPEHYSMELSLNSGRDHFQLPASTHSIHLSLVRSSSSSSTGLSLGSQLDNLGEAVSDLSSLRVTESQTIMVRAGAPSLFSAPGSLYRSCSNILTLRTTPATPLPTQVCRCRSVPSTFAPTIGLDKHHEKNPTPVHNPFRPCLLHHGCQMFEEHPDASNLRSVQSGLLIRVESSSRFDDCLDFDLNDEQALPVQSVQSEPSLVIPSSSGLASSPGDVRWPHPLPTRSDTCIRFSQDRSAWDNQSVKLRTPNDKKMFENIGRKRQQRNANDRYLSGIGVDEPDSGPQLIADSRFGVLFRDDESLQVWTTFMQSPEEVQNEIMKNTSKKTSPKNKKKSLIRGIKKSEATSSVSESSESVSERAFSNLTQNQQNLLIRQNVPYGMVAYLESLVYEHFGMTPSERFVSPPLSSFERLILHSVSAYYSLSSQTIEDATGRRVVVTNSSNVFVTPGMRLIQFIDLLEKRHLEKAGISTTK